MNERFMRQLAFIVEIDKMKSVYRQTLLTDRARAETDAEHSWHFALAAMVLLEYAETPVDINRVIKMALVHDLVEIYAGDTFAYDEKGYSDKPERERNAADKIFGMPPDEQGAELRGFWEEFERMETPDALYANALDRLMPFIINHATDGYTWVKHGVSAARIYKRMRPVEKALPALWAYIERVVREALDKGYIKP